MNWRSCISSAAAERAVAERRLTRSRKPLLDFGAPLRTRRQVCALLERWACSVTSLHLWLRAPSSPSPARPPLNPSRTSRRWRTWSTTRTPKRRSLRAALVRRDGARAGPTRRSHRSFSCWFGAEPRAQLASSRVAIIEACGASCEAARGRNTRSISTIGNAAEGAARPKAPVSRS